MEIRRATAFDLNAVQDLWQAFSAEVPEPGHITVDLKEELREVAEIVSEGLAFVAEEDGALVGFALAQRVAPTVAKLTDLYVVRESRRAGLGARLVHELVSALDDDGVEHLDLEVLSGNAAARSIYQRWGFVEHTLVLGAPVASLRERLEPGRHAVSFASLHVQTDDVSAVERAVTAFAPRIGSRRNRVEGPRNGWTAIYDEVADRDPTVLVRFGREVSSRLGAVVVALSLEVEQVVRLVALDRGGIVDEYLSVPEFYGVLPPGDVIGLAANPTVLQRLTGADPAAVKAAARTAGSAAELPPARELLAAIATALGIEGADHGYGEA
jgi:ribosomal protein S18 acetylase RimI-like enzyme